MLKRALFLSLAVIFIFSLSGCATGRKQKDLESQGLRNQISVLEAHLRAKDQEIESLKEALAGTETKQVTSKKESKQLKVIAETKSRPNIRQIQAALGNAGYDPGRVDGRMGKRTRDAIRAFQRDNNLQVDGKVGKKTWVLLKEYLYKKSK